jgi:hypothetical protein
MGMVGDCPNAQNDAFLINADFSISKSISETVAVREASFFAMT